MPSKTKKEKLLTQKRRSQTPLSMPTFSLSFDNSQNPKTSDLAVVRTDITKTIVLGLIGIAAELSLYWYSISRPYFS